MKIVEKIRDKVSERHKLFLVLDILFSLFAIYFAVHGLFISIPGLLNPSVSNDIPSWIMFGMVFCLGLTYVIRVVEMVVTGKREYFILSLFAAIFIMSVSVYMFVL
ncbi:hypothetical protein [Gracilibacillus massiliensis]|uniref:hypothetical protein n=1 Tax=Gracilibacillus massiliensis TaxID=1564956 RepID=UPI00071C3F2C|nr:hypothetical protein [Gracilibacillus massiliensis]